MIIRINTVMEKAIKHAAKLSKTSKFQRARKVLKDAGVSPLTMERVLYEPHNIRYTD